jgi:hypothetical protein
MHQQWPADGDIEVHRELAGCVFSNRYDISSRFFVALIGGTIVGLFNNFTVPGASLSPLALAFLVGYGADFFFSFLDGLLSSLKDGRVAQNTVVTTNQRPAH